VREEEADLSSYYSGTSFSDEFLINSNLKGKYEYSAVLIQQTAKSKIFSLLEHEFGKKKKKKKKKR